MQVGPFQVGGRVSRTQLAINPAVWFLFAAMFGIFAIGTSVMAFVVPELRPSTCLPFAALLAVVSAVAFASDPPELGSKSGHAAIAAVYVCTALGMLAFRPDSLIPLSPAMFLAPFAASRLTTRAQIAAHCLAGSVALGIPAALGLVGDSASFAVVLLIPTIWLLGACVVVVLEAAEAQGAELEHLVLRDPLTGAGNRRLLNEQLAAELTRHERLGVPLSLLALDLNGFKALNDTVGHAAGDAVLQHVARALQAVAREQDVVVRQGGDEFCLLLADTTADQARFVAREIRTRLAALADGTLPITTGVGIATFPVDAQSADQLLTAADADLAVDKARTDPLLDPRRGGAEPVVAAAQDEAAWAGLPSEPSSGLVLARVSRLELAHHPATWLVTGVMYGLFAMVAAGCSMWVAGAASWSPALAVITAATAAVMLTRDGPAIGTWANHVVVAGTALGAAAFMATFPTVAGGALGVAIFIGPLTAVRLIDRRQITAHLVVSTAWFVGLVAVGLVDLTTSLSLMIMVLTFWGLCAACVAVLEAAERQGDELERLVRRDPLTGVGNRRMLSEQLAYELARHSRNRQPLTVLALDLNGFKALNDQFGHAAGDELLCSVARAIEDAAGDGDTVVRQGGDEFCVLLPNATGEQAMSTADSIRAALAVIDAHGLTITTGIGIASYPTEATTADGLLTVADDLLRASKATALARERRSAHRGQAKAPLTTGHEPSIEGPAEHSS